jgi:UDP-glucuronate decarboxylase
MIRWITDYLGTAPWELAKNTTGVKILDVRDLVDATGNSTELVAAKIKAGTELIENGEKLIVCCEYGMSRSNAIAVGILCNIEKLTFNQSLKLVISLTKEEQIKLSVLKSVSQIFAVSEANSQEKKILVIDYEGYIAKSLMDLSCSNKFVIPDNFNLDVLLYNPALFYLFVIENNINSIAFISCKGIINTNQFISDLLLIIKNVLDVIVSTNCDLYFISTLDLFLGYDRKSVTIKHNTLKKPHGNKGLAYSLAEDLLLYHKKIYKLNIAIIRIPIVYGYQISKPYFIANFIQKAKSNIDIRIHQYKNNLAWVNLIHVKDVARFILKVIDNKYFEVYHIDGSEKLNTYEISKNIIKMFSSTSNLQFIQMESNIVKINVNMSYLEEELSWKPQENFYKTIKDNNNGKTPN